MWSWIILCFSSITAFAQVENIEIRAYIQKEQIPKYVPLDCPILKQQVQDDVLALRAVNTIMYELINFWGEDDLEGAEVYSDGSTMNWKIAKAGNNSFEVVAVTKSIRLGQKMYNIMETQAEQECFEWSLVISNEEVVVLDDTPMKSFAEEDIAYQRFDPYAEEYTVKPEPPAVNNTRDKDDFLAYEPITLSRTNTVAMREPEIKRTETITNDNTGTYNSNRRSEFSAMLPNPSAQLTLPADLFKSIQSLGEVERLIVNALDKKGYDNKGYFEFENGFMIATQLEHFNSNGTSKAAQYRYPSGITFNQSLSFQNYVSSLFLSEVGLYRMFVFYVEAAPRQTYGDMDYSLSRTQMVQSESTGLRSEALINKPYRHKSIYDSNVTVMVYEFQVKPNERRPVLLSVSSLTTQDHLTRSGLWDAFKP